MKKLFIGVAILLAGAAQAAPKWPTWAPEASIADLRVKHPGEKAVVVQDDWEITVRGGERRGVRRVTVAVLTDEGAPEATLSLGRNTFHDFSGLREWVRRPDGKVVAFDEDDGSIFAALSLVTLDDYEALVARPSGVQAGAVVAAQYEFRTTADLPQDTIGVQRGIPVLALRVHVDARQGWSVLARVSPGSNPGPSATTTEGVWSFSDVPAATASEEAFAPAPEQMTLQLDYVPPGGRAAFADWGSAARWAAALYRQPPLSGPGPAAPPGDDPVAAVGRAVRAIRYFGIEIGWGGWVPRRPDVVLSRGLGDCKDKALLMVELLRRRGVAAVPVLIVSPRDHFVDEALPSVFVFDHAIVGVLWDRPAPVGAVIVDAPGVGRLRLYDATLAPASPLELSSRHEGARALVADERTTGLAQVPVRGAAETRWDRRIRMTVGASGSVDVEVANDLGGPFRERLETQRGEIVTRAELRRQLLPSASYMCPGFTEFSADEPRAGEAWGFSYRFRCPQGLGAFGRLRALPVPDSSFSDLFFVAAKEKPGTIYFPNALTVTETIEIDGDLVGRTAALPRDAEVANALGAVSVVARRESGRIVLERRATLKVREVEPSQLPALRELDRGMRRLSGLVVVFDDGADAPAVTPNRAASR